MSLLRVLFHGRLYNSRQCSDMLSVPTCVPLYGSKLVFQIAHTGFYSGSAFFNLLDILPMANVLFQSSKLQSKRGQGGVTLGDCLEDISQCGPRLSISGGGAATAGGLLCLGLVADICRLAPLCSSDSEPTSSLSSIGSNAFEMAEPRLEMLGGEVRAYRASLSSAPSSQSVRGSCCTAARGARALF